MEIEKNSIPVVLITKAFPFNVLKAPAENYLINEIYYLAELFSTIYVISTDSNKDDEITVKLPANVIAINASEGTFKRKVNLVVLSAKHFFDFKTYEFQKLGVKKRVKYAFFRGKSDYYYRMLNKHFVMKEYVNSEQSLLLYTFWFYTYTLAALMLKEKKYCNAITVTRAHGYDLYSERNALNYLPLREYLLGNIDKVFTCSQNGQKYLSAKYSQYNNKIATAYLGSEDHGVKKYESEGVFTIVSCSRVESVKRVELLAETIVYLHKNGKKIRWLHIGDGTQFNNIKQIVKRQIDLEVVYLYGAIDNEKIYEIYKSEKVDLFVNVSESEGLPISIMEACSVGLPILATDVGGVSEIVDDNNGWLLPVDINSEQLALEIIKISALPKELLQAKGEFSRKKWETNFCIENNLKQMIWGILNEK